MQMTQSFKEIVAWQKAHAFVIQVYQACALFPAHERYGLCSQFERAAVSIAANIAEGYKRLGREDKIRFFNYSQGSLEECRCYIYLANDFRYISTDEANQMIAEIEETSKVLNGYINTMQNRKSWES